eukprot:4040646-Pleurochrysis_carterae.AAC.3
MPKSDPMLLRMSERLPYTPRAGVYRRRSDEKNLACVLPQAHGRKRALKDKHKQERARTCARTGIPSQESRSDGDVAIL